MPSTFFGLSIAGTGLNAFQNSANTAANNISNSKTEGYTRQRVNLSEAEAIRTFQKFGTAGTGVNTDSITQIRDQYYDEKFWNNSKNYGEYSKRQYYLRQIEDYFKDNPDVPGFTTIFSKMFASLDTLKTHAGDPIVRNQFINDADQFTDYFNQMSTKLRNLQTSVNDEIKATVDNINSTMKKIATLNQQINVIEVRGDNANDLRDRRALLLDSLSKIVPIHVEEHKVVNSNYPDMYTGAHNFLVKLNGKTIIDNYDYTPISITIRENKHNQSDVEGLYDLKWSDTEEPLNMNAKTMGGTLKAMFTLRDGNNSENLTGTVFKTTANTVSIKNPSITKVEYMNMPEKGIVYMDGVPYPYNKFEAHVDKNGNIDTYTFTLARIMDANVQERVSGGRLDTGESVNFKGIPYYLNQMSLFLRSFSKEFNQVEQQGKVGTDGQMGAFFVYNDEFKTKQGAFKDVKNDSIITGTSDTYYKMTAMSFDIVNKSKKDPSYFATTYLKKDEKTGAVIDEGSDAYSVVEKLLKLQSDVKIFRNSSGSDFLHVIYSDITVDTQESNVFSKNFEEIEKAIEKQRQGVSGVDEDNEALDLVKFQNAYNLSSKIIQTLAEMYDRLITQTGV